MPRCATQIPLQLVSFIPPAGKSVGGRQLSESSLSGTFCRMERAALCRVMQRRACNYYPNLRQLWRITSAPELPVGLTETFVAMVWQFQFTSPHPQSLPNKPPAHKSLSGSMILGFPTGDRRIVPDCIPLEIHEMIVSSQNLWYWILWFLKLRIFLSWLSINL